MLYSKRLTSLTSHFVFVFVGIAGTTQLFIGWFDNPLVRFLVIPMVLLYLFIGTVGWTWTQKTGLYQTLYFIVMVLLGNSIIIISTALLREGIVGAIIILPLTMHGAVLSQNYRRLFVFMIILGVAISGLLESSVYGLLSIASVISGIISFDFVGRVIVSEEKAHEELARYSKEIEELSIMRERNRLAREIHDNLGHYLTAINMQAQAAHAVLGINPQQASEALTNIQNLAREGLQEVRKSITALRASPMENRLLHEALEILISEAQAQGLAIDFQIEGEPSANSAEVEMTLYRVLQEALTNIHKHAQAQQAQVVLRYEKSSDCVCLKVCDNGRGTNNSDGGFGLLGLRERVRLLGGKFQIQTAPGKGFCMEVELMK